MLSNFNPYASEPALPVLAHSLLSRQHTPDPNLAHLDNQSTTWDLSHDIYRGFQSSSTSVFQYGTIIGFSKLRRRNHDHDIAELPRALTASHLSQASSSCTPSPRVYIIHPANYTGFSPQKLLDSLLSAPSKPLSRSEAISRLDAVQLLPVFDLPAAVQAIHEVSQALDKQQEERRRDPTTNHCSVLFIIAGLDSLIEGVVRASNAVRGAAVLTTVLRSLTQLSRMHRFYLSVMLVNTTGIGTMPSATTGHPERARADNDHPPPHDDGVHSVFGAADTSLFPSLLMRTMDQGIDSHLLMSTVKGAHVVEVMKDRVGENTGKWSVWKPGQ